MPSGAEWFIVLAVVLVIFGGSQLPKLAKNLGKAQKEFKDGSGRRPSRRDRQARRSIRRRRAPRPAPTPDRPTRASPLVRQRCLRRRQSALDGETPALEDAPALALAAPAPHAVVDAVLEGVLQARLGDRAAGADLAGLVDARRRRSGRTSPAGTAGSSPPPSTPSPCPASLDPRAPSCSKFIAAAPCVTGVLDPRRPPSPTVPVSGKRWSRSVSWFAGFTQL